MPQREHTSSKPSSKSGKNISLSLCLSLLLKACYSNAMKNFEQQSAFLFGLVGSAEAQWNSQEISALVKEPAALLKFLGVGDLTGPLAVSDPRRKVPRYCVIS